MTENSKENQDNNQGQNSFAVIGTGGAAGVSAALARSVYDKTARQVFTFETEDATQRYELTFAVDGIADEDMFEFDKLQTTQFVGDLQVSDTLSACKWFFDNRISLIDGFEGELPIGWQKEFDDDEKQAIVLGMLSANVYESADEEKTLGKRQFGAAKPEDTITVKSNFNGAETLTRFNFPPKNQRHIAAYKKATSGTVAKPGREGRFLRDSWQTLSELYEEMKVSCDSNPAVHLIVVAMHERFGTSASLQTKKRKR